MALKFVMLQVAISCGNTLPLKSLTTAPEFLRIGLSAHGFWPP